MSFTVPGGGAAGGGNIRIAKLNLANYVHWRIEMEQVLQMRGAWDVLFHVRPEVPVAMVAPAPPGGMTAAAAVGTSTGAPSMTATSGDAASSMQTGQGQDTTGTPADAAKQAAHQAYQSAMYGHNQREAMRAQAAKSAREWDRQNVLARGLIILALEPVHQVVAGRHATAKGVWDALDRDFRSRGMARAQMLRTQLDALQKTGNETVLEFVARARTIQWELKELGEEASDRAVLMTILSGLPADYIVTAGILEANNSTLEDAMPALITAEQRIAMQRNRKGNSGRDVGAALAASASGDITCYGCGRRGHIQRHCRSSGNGDGNRAPGGGTGRGGGGPLRASHNRFRGGGGHNGAPRPNARAAGRGTRPAPNADDAHALSAIAAVETQAMAGLCTDGVPSNPATPNKWLIDSGASHHMTHSLNIMSYVKEITPMRINMANGETRLATHKGSILIYTVTAEGTRPLMLTGALYVPGLSANLFSVPKSVKMGTHVSFTDIGVSLTFRGREVANGYAHRGVYILNLGEGQAMAAASGINGLKWHRRFGHAGGAALARIPAAVDGMHADTTELRKVSGQECAACAVAKMTRLVYTPATNPPSGVLDLVHTDVCGHMPVDSTGGSRYFVTLIDGLSHYAVAIPIRSKDEAGTVVRDTLLQWERATGLKVKTLRRDGGGEYTGPELTQWLRSNGVTVQTTAPETPEQNGVAERYNRTLAEKAVAMMEDAGLPKAVWAEAVTTANYTSNRIPRVGETTTPYERFFGNKPAVADLRAFGCRAVVLALKKGRRKLDPRGQSGVFVGYSQSSKAWRVQVGAKVMESRNVRFNEDEFPSLGKTAEVGPEQDMAKVLAACRLVTGTEPEAAGISDDVAVGAADAVPSADATDGSDVTIDGTSDVDDEEGAALSARASPDRMSEAEARKQPDWPLFEKAAHEEVGSLWENGTWVPVPHGKVPMNAKIIDTMLIFDRKRDQNGKVERHKARNVGKGFLQVAGRDYTEKWAPVVRQATLRTLLAVAAAKNLHMEQMDIKTAFLNGTLKEELYVRQPKGFERGDPTQLCRLVKAIYGLKQAAREWYLAFITALSAAGFERSAADPCLLYKKVGDGMVYILVYVDDLLVVGSSVADVKAAKTAVLGHFKARDMGEPEWFLGMHIIRDRAAGTITLSQRQYAKTLVERYGMEDANPTTLPMPVGSRIRREGAGLEGASKAAYPEMIGALLYLATSTRPDIAYSVARLARYTASPTEEHRALLKGVLRYVKGTQSWGLTYGRGAPLTGYTDADFAGDLDTRRSTTGFVFTLNGAAVAWASKTQATVAASTTEAEYIAAAVGAREALWLAQLLRDIGVLAAGSVQMYGDNQAALTLIKNPMSVNRCKHIDIAYHFVRDRVERGELTVEHIPTAKMVADVLTKALPSPALAMCCLGMGLGPSSH